MSGWAIFWIIVAALVVFGIVVNLRELIRYLKIRSMLWRRCLVPQPFCRKKGGRSASAGLCKASVFVPRFGAWRAIAGLPAMCGTMPKAL